MRDYLAVVARPKGAYQSFMSNDLVCRTAPESSEICAEASPNLANPDRANDGRRMYYEHQLVFDRERLPPELSEIPDDDLRELLRLLLHATDLCSWSDFPLPCAGLAGFLHKKYDQTDEAGDLISIGLEYLGAVVNNERRTMHLRWQAAKDMIHKLRNSATKETEDRIFTQQIRWAEEERTMRAEATPQLVYFIASESGPIKIGIASNPKSRLGGLQTGHHEKLDLLATCEGGQEQERAYHKLFADRRLNGEWFERCPEIEAEIARLGNLSGDGR